MRDSYDVPLIPMRDYPTVMHPVVDGYLDHPSVTTLVDVGETGMLRGFIAADPTPYFSYRYKTELAGYVYYVYVAGPFRGWQIAAQLFLAAGIDRAAPFGFAVKTRSSFEAREKFPGAKYDSHRARYLTTETPA